MPENRFFADSLFEKGLQIPLSGDEYRHMRVMRKEQGASVELVNGKNQLAKAKVLSFSKNEALLELTSVTNSPPPKNKRILVQALLKPKNLDLVIEKGTELGATAFWLFPGELSEKKNLTETQLTRYCHLTIAALKQCGRLDLPEIRIMPYLAKWERFPPGKYFFGDPNSNKNYTPAEGDHTLFVGPEKGFSDVEEKILAKQAQGVRIHPYVLRAETAALCFLALSSQI